MWAFGNVLKPVLGTARLRLMVACLVLLAFGVPASAQAKSALWTRSWTPRAGYQIYQVRLAPAPLGGVYVGTGPCSPTHVASGIAVARYTPSGVRLWAKLLSTASHSAMAAIAADQQGGLVVAGAVPTAAGGTQWRLIKVSPGGKQLWKASLQGIATAASGPSAMAIDAAGDIYVCGQVVRAGTGSDVTLAKFGPTGKLRWARFVDGDGHDDDLVTALARDPAGGIYIGGHLKGIATGYDAFVARYSPSGARDWLQTWDNVSSSGDDCGWALAASSFGVALAGSTTGVWDDAYGTWDQAGLVLGYTPAGALWLQHRVPGAAPSGGFNAAYIDETGGVAAAGNIWAGGVPSVPKAVLLKLRPDGSEEYSLWLPTGPNGGGFEALTSRRGTLAACGFVENARGGSDIFLHVVPPNLMNAWSGSSNPSRARNDGTSVLFRGGAIYVGGTRRDQVGLLRF